MLTYQDYLQTKIDLAPLGIEQAENFVPYFCTPQEANVIGCAGIDGIHFCFIKGFGEMIFAISPCNDIGNYIHPIARNFGDLLSLLVACNDVAALEQAWMWNKEAFTQFIHDNIPTKEQVQTIQKLQHELNIPMIQDPYDYLQQLQSECDISQIKFSDEYYDVVGE